MKVLALAVGAALLLGTTTLPAQAQQPAQGTTELNADLRKIYEGVYGLYDKAEKGNSRAAFLIAALHSNGIFLPQDTAKAQEFLEAAAAKGDAEAMYYLGLHHHHGVGNYKVDKEKAAELI